MLVSLVVVVVVRAWTVFAAVLFAPAAHAWAVFVLAVSASFLHAVSASAEPPVVREVHANQVAAVVACAMPPVVATAAAVPPVLIPDLLLSATLSDPGRSGR